MGPFFWLGHLLACPAWVVQRLWWRWCCASRSSASRLPGALGSRSDLACIVAGFAYALSPRMLTTLGPISIEAWPSALAPGCCCRWCRAATARLAAPGGRAVGARRRHGRRGQRGGHLRGAPARRGWLLTRTPRAATPRADALVACRSPLLGTLWWLVPLLLLGRLQPAVPRLHRVGLDHHRSRRRSSTRCAAPRNWVPYVDPRSRAGNDLHHASPFLILNSGVVLVLGLAGLLHRAQPAPAVPGRSASCRAAAGDAGPPRAGAGLVRRRPCSRCSTGRWRRCATCTSSTRSSGCRWCSGWPGCVDAPGSADDAPSAATGGRRSTAAGAPSVRGSSAPRWSPSLGAAIPALAGRIAPAGRLRGVPGYWTQAADWLDEQPRRRDRAARPGLGFGDLRLGVPARRADPVPRAQPVGGAQRRPARRRRATSGCSTRSRRGSRRASGSPGSRRTSRAPASPTWWSATTSPQPPTSPTRCWCTRPSTESPGTGAGRDFGPDVGGEAHLDSDEEPDPGQRRLADRVPRHRDLRGRRRRDRRRDADGAPVVVGGPEDLLDLTDVGLLGDEPTVLAVDAPTDADPDAAADPDRRPADARTPLRSGARRRVRDAAPATTRAARQPAPRLPAATTRRPVVDHGPDRRRGVA